MPHGYMIVDENQQPIRVELNDEVSSEGVNDPFPIFTSMEDAYDVAVARIALYDEPGFQRIATVKYTIESIVSDVVDVHEEEE